MAERQRETVLIVEDDPGIARLESLRLERAGYNTATARTSDQALEVVRRGGIDLLVLDQNLAEGATGLDFYSRLRAEGFDLPAILVTGFSDETTLVRAIRGGLRDFVPKTEAFLDDLSPIVDRVMDQVRTEQRLAESEARLAALIASALDGVMMLNSAGRITLFNPAAERLFRIEASAAERLTIHDLIPDWPCEPSGREDQDGALSLPGALRLECEGKRADGTLFPLEVSASFVQVAGGAFRTLILRDLTAQKQAEQERLERFRAEAARAEAEAANLAKDRFLAVLSHELRNPLSPALLATSSLLEDPDVPDSIRETLEMVRRNLLLEARLMDDLLDVTRINQGKLQLDPKLVDAHLLIDQTLEICRDDVTGAGLELRRELAATRTHVEVDPARFQQILWNLVKNAVKFTPSGGWIAIRTYNEIDSERDGLPRLVVEVSDCGVGIPPEVLPRLFEPFEQGGTEVTRRYGGLGLGLAISRWVAAAHGGTLLAESAGAGCGATFTLCLATLDASPAAEQADPDREPPIDRSPLERVLVVEDQPDSRALLVRLLQRRGFQVVAVEDCASAVREARQAPFDLLICDIGLPDGSGLDLLGALRETCRNLKGIVMSGYGRDEDVRRTEAAGFSGHLTKPIDIDRLDSLLREVAEAPAKA